MKLNGPHVFHAMRAGMTLAEYDRIATAFETGRQTAIDRVFSELAPVIRRRMHSAKPVMRDA